MRGHKRESGFALILLLAITAALAILAATLVMFLGNQQHTTAMNRSSKTSLYYAEAALNSAATAVEGTNSWLTTPYTDSTAMGANYNTLSGAPTVTYRVYDNATPVNYSTNYDANGDGEVWVETTTTYNGRTTRVRELVSSATKVSILPKAAAYSDTNMTLSGTSNIYAVNSDGTPDTSGAPYVTTIMVGGNFTANSSADLAAPADSTSTQSLGLQVNGSVTTPGHSFSPTIGGAGLLSDYFDQAHQAALTTEAQACQNNVSTLFDLSPGSTHTYTSQSALISAMSYNSSTRTYTASSDMEYNNTNTPLTLNTASNKYNFQKLYVNGSLTLTGNITVNTTALYVGGDFTISGATTAIIDHSGPLYVSGVAEWTGQESVRTTDYTKANADATPPDMTNNPPGPMWVARLHRNWTSGGYYTDVYGPTWVNGGNDTANTVLFAGPTSGTTACAVWCPLLATTEQTTMQGLVNFGSLTNPMVYYMQCDNDGYVTANGYGGYVNTCQMGTTGTYYGLMILFEASIFITGNSGASVPNVVGAVMDGAPAHIDINGAVLNDDIALSNTASICYNQTVIDNCTSDSLKTTTTAPVPGSWQQLSP